MDELSMYVAAAVYDMASAVLLVLCDIYDLMNRALTWWRGNGDN